MKNALKTTSRFAVLGLLVAGLSGCGTQNPMGPSMTDTAATPALSTEVSSTPIVEDPTSTEPGTRIADPTDPPTKKKKATGVRSVDHPGNGNALGVDF